MVFWLYADTHAEVHNVGGVWGDRLKLKSKVAWNTPSILVIY